MTGRTRSGDAGGSTTGSRRRALPATGDGQRGTWAGANWSAPARLGTTGRLAAYPLRGVWLIEVDPPYDDTADEVDHAVQLALAECPRGVVVSLTGPLDGTSEHALEVLASTGRHVAPWPAIPVVLAVRDPCARGLFAGRAGAEHLVHASSMLHGWTQVMTRRAPTTAQVRLGSGAVASRNARRFLIRCCLDWGLNQQLASGPLVVSELVTNAIQHANSDIDVVLAAHDGRLRVGVRDRSPAPPVTRHAPPDATGGRGLRVVEALARSSGAWPTVDGGKFVWAVLGP
ncbi:Histidine kinase-like ATPase domain-containing protein [Pedococcus cremeus]|uniref:Histidine kinase-like ATPase domain-containing protein n=1 Tax=Pedococcus cremeus TaxID=587636 RepID=A0A1H9TNP6_9MICO|nr:ATP-binding protein [Pedococcus cremeus]SER98624.1 Histidine kinase-like ATPase domain-containing protein [Pedococcus cremeus]